MTAETWQDIVSKKQLENASMIPPAWRLPEHLTRVSETSGTNVIDVPRQSGILTERQLEITELYDATDLLRKMEHRELSAYEVTEAFCIRAAIAQQVVRFFILSLTSAMRYVLIYTDLLSYRGLLREGAAACQGPG